MKKLTTALLCLIMLTMLSFSAAASDEQRVFDNAGLFSSGEISQLEEKIADLRERSGYDIVILTTDDTGGFDTESYGDYYYNNGDFGINGAMFLIDMDNREITLFTPGKGMSEISQTKADGLLDYTQEYAIDGDYYGCAKAFLRKIEPCIIKSVNSTELLIIIPVAILVGLIFYFVIIKKYNSVGKKEPYPFKEQSNLNLTKKDDIFVDRHVSTVRISSSSGSHGSRGGGSSSRGSRGF